MELFRVRRAPLAVPGGPKGALRLSLRLLPEIGMGRLVEMAGFTLRCSLARWRSVYEGADFFRLVPKEVPLVILARLGDGWSQVEGGGTTGERGGGLVRWAGRVGVAWKPFHCPFT